MSKKEYNKFKDLTSRDLVGLGYRNKGKYVNFGIGAFAENEIIEDNTDQNAIIGNIYLSNSIENETGFEFSSIAYLQTSLKQSNGLRTIF